MKKRSIAFLLSLVMLLSLLTPTALAEEPDQEGQATEESTEIPALSETTVAVPREAAFGDETTVTAPEGAESYQWQFRLMEDLWVNISGDESAEIVLTYAKVCNMLDESGAASLRCLVDGQASETLTVTVTDEPAQEPGAAEEPDEMPVPDEEPVLDEEPVIQPVLPILDPQQSAEDTIVGVSNGAVGAQEGNGDEEDTGNEPATPSTYTILINYQFANGTQAAPSWSATVATGSTYTQDIQSPVVVGYTPREATVHVNTSEAKTYTVIYDPAEVEFTVKHYQQNVSNDLYTLVSTETKTGYTESAVGENLAKTDYTGFYSLLYDTTTKIAADGSTVVEVYYDRYYYLMNFDLDGGYGVEPIYARYGAAISVTNPTKPGYTFTSWDKTIPTTMPAENRSFKANWVPGEAGFIVVFWYENANDDGYSVAGTYKPADVAPGTEQKSGDYQNTDFEGKDADEHKHFTYNADKAETVTVKGDGSSVLNVYYTRNTYKLTFPGCGDTTVLSCGKVEHEHTHDECCTKTGWHIHGYGLFGYCNSKKCPVGYEHSHSSSCYSNDLVITAKYDSDITYVWKTDPIKSLLDQGYVFKSSVTDSFYSFLEKMPGQDITMTKTQWSGSTYEWYYYLEVPSGMSAPAGATTKTDGDKTYYLYHTVKTKSESRLVLTYDEDYYPITGFTQRDGKTENGWHWDGQYKAFVHSFENYKAYLYYTRNSYDLKFINYGTTVKTETKYYQEDISGENFTPDYPETLESNAYVFDGWYTDQFFSENGKFDFTGATMPAGPVVLYAHWVPKFHTVKTYLTKDVLDNNGDPLETWDKVPHGTAVENPPENPTREPYKFVGWFYISDTGEEKAFDFSMPVNRDLNLYAKWSSNTLMEYTIRYELEDGTEIAPPTTGSALAGTTKTFDAKTGMQLNEGYQSGYFPKVSSHSLTLDIDDRTKNEFTFVYVAKPAVEYTVKYLEKGTGNQLADPKTVTTRDAVVTETFKQITGYAPDAYQKQLVLAAEGNEIIFWYVKDEDHAPVQVIHWTQNIEGDGYTEYQSSTNLNGVIGNPYTEAALNIPGFTYNTSKSNASGTLTAEGLVLNLYYDRIMYPYEFRFLEQGTDKELADPVTGSARYQAQVTQGYKPIPGYTLVSAENQAINIAIEDPADTASKNVKTFYYSEQTVEIKYEVVGPTGCGTLDNYQESQLKVITGTPKGSTPTAKPGFKFVGWYTSADCQILVKDVMTGAVDSTTNKVTPQKSIPLGNGVSGYAAATYYAKFEPDVADLTITKSGCANIDEHQSFIFTVTGGDLPAAGLKVVVTGNGSVTIKGLKVGTTYTITEDTGWSWRYTPEDGEQKKTLDVDKSKNTVIFSNERTEPKWLNGCSWAENNWASGKKKTDKNPDGETN